MPVELGLASTFSEPSALARPLCVELDGTLVSSDTLSEEMLLLLKQRPWFALVAPFWLLAGRARYKRLLSEHVRLDPESLPNRRELVDALRESRARERKIVLATAADRQVASAVAQHLELFDEVHASDGELNLTSNHKRDALNAAAAPSSPRSRPRRASLRPGYPRRCTEKTVSRKHRPKGRLLGRADPHVLRFLDVTQEGPRWFFDSHALRRVAG
jgi:hypothetical protein